MKQILITITMLAIALALIIGVIVPIFKHGAEMGDTAVSRGESIIARIGQVLK
ncbi:MAG: hypothetical protein ACYDG2_08190 [Ruminiclostridium sp.]